MTVSGLKTRPPGLLQDFLAWWGEELEGLLAAGSPRRRPTDVLVGLIGEHLVVSQRRGKAEKPLGAVDLQQPSEAVAAELSAIRRKIGKKRPRVALRLPFERVVIRTIELPAAAAAAVRPVVSHQLDRVTPWSARQCRFDCVVEPGSPKAPRIAVRLAAAPHRLLDGPLARLEAAGLKPLHIFVLGSDGRVDPDIDLARDEAAQQGFWLRRLLAFAALALAMGALSLAGWGNWRLYERESQIEALETRAATLRNEQQLVERLRTEIAALRADTRRLLEIKRASPSMAVLLEALSRLLPRQVWLTEVDFDGKRLRIAGFAPKASDVLELLEGSRHFSQVEFASPIVTDAETGAERLDLTMVIEPLLDPAP